MTIFQKTLLTGAEKIGVTVNEEQLNQFQAFYDFLIKVNQTMNLTRVVGEEEAAWAHFVDSMSAVPYLTERFGEEFSFVDVGSGAGFPGVVLKIMLPKAKVCLLDSLGKRVNYLNDLIFELGLLNIEAYHGRAEEKAHDPEYRERFDVAMARAVANQASLNEYLSGFVRPGGCILALKGPKVEEELDLANRFRTSLALSTPKMFHVELLSPAENTMADHRLVVYDKEKMLAKAYPRTQAKMDKDYKQ